MQTFPPPLSPTLTRFPNQNPLFRPKLFSTHPQNAINWYYQLQNHTTGWDSFLHGPTNIEQSGILHQMRCNILEYRLLIGASQSPLSFPMHY